MDWKNIFKRNKNKETKAEETTREKMTKKGFTYRVTIGDPLARSYREIDTFGAMKTRDDDGVVWLFNQEKNFKESFPLDDDYQIKYTIEQLEDEIKKIKAKKIKAGENSLNKESKLYELEKMKKLLQYKGGSFVKIDKDGIPHILYIRYRTSYIPWKWNIDFGLIHTPPESLVKNILGVQLEKMKKYHQKKENLLGGTLIIGYIILVAWTAILGYMTLQSFSKADDSKVADLQARIDQCGLAAADLYAKAGQNFYSSSIYQLNFTKTVFDRLNPKLIAEPATTSVE